MREYMVRNSMVAGMAFMLLVGMALRSNAADGTAADDVALKMGWVLGSTPIKVRFVLQNESTRPVKTTPIATNRNRIVIITPTGKSVEHYFAKDGIKAITVPSGGQQAWEVNMAEVLKHEELTTTGYYEFYWFVDGFKSERMFVFID